MGWNMFLGYFVIMGVPYIWCSFVGDIGLRMGYATILRCNPMEKSSRMGTSYDIPWGYNWSCSTSWWFLFPMSSVFLHVVTPRGLSSERRNESRSRFISKMFQDSQKGVGTLRKKMGVLCYSTASSKCVEDCQKDDVCFDLCSKDFGLSLGEVMIYRDN